MRCTPVLQSLVLPALALAAGLTLACADGGPTAPAQAPAAAAARGPRAMVVDDDGNLKCRPGYTLSYAGFDSPYDLNHNLYVCVYNKDGGKPLYQDDGARGCPSGYTLVQVSDGSWGKEYDLNGNGYVCQIAA